MPNVTNQDSNRTLQPKTLYEGDKEEVEIILNLLKKNEDSHWSSFGHDAESYLIRFRDGEEKRFKTSDELKAIFEERREA